jgi:hypothetical protein
MIYYMTGNLYRMWDASEVVSCYEAVAEDWLKRISLGGRVLSPDEGCTHSISTMLLRGKYLDTYVLAAHASIGTKHFFKDHMGTGYWCDVKEVGRPRLLDQADVTSATAVNTKRQLLQNLSLGVSSCWNLLATAARLSRLFSSAQQAAPITCHSADVAAEHVAASANGPSMPGDVYQAYVQSGQEQQDLAIEPRETFYVASAKRQRLAKNLSNDMDQSTSTVQDDGLLT